MEPEIPLEQVLHKFIRGGRLLVVETLRTASPEAAAGTARLLPPDAVSDETRAVTADRLLHLVWTVASACEPNRRAAERYTTRVLADVDWPAACATDPADLRRRWITVLGRRFAHRRPDRFAAAAREALTYDTFLLLPPEQRALVTDVTLNHRPLAEAAATSGQPVTAAAASLRAALHTLAQGAGGLTV